MADEPLASESDAPSRLPWILFAISTAFAVLASTGFVYLIAKRTTGPAEVLHDFYEAVHDGECADSYELLSPTTQGDVVNEEAWCSGPATFPETLPSSFRTEQVTLQGDVAVVDVVEPDGTERRWRLTRADRSWWIDGGPEPADSPQRPPETPAT